MSGPLQIGKKEQLVCNLFISDVELNKNLEKFGKIKETWNSSNSNNYSPGESDCERYFAETVYCDVDENLLCPCQLDRN